MILFLRFLLSSIIVASSILPQEVVSGRFRNTGGGGSAPTFQTSGHCNAFGSSIACSYGSVTAGWTLHYAVEAINATPTFTITDNCNTGGITNTYTTDVGPTALSTAAAMQSGHATVGASTASCTITFAWTGGGDGQAVVASMSGSSGLDVVAAINNQTNAPTTANGVTSNAVMTNFKDLCIGYMADSGVAGGTVGKGTTLAWNLGVQGAFGVGNEYFAQSASGSNTATFQYSAAFENTQAGVSCFKP